MMGFGCRLERPIQSTLLPFHHGNMVLVDLGKKINSAINSLTGADSNGVIDEKVLDGVIKDICRALLEADVNVNQVKKLRQNIKSSVKLPSNNSASGGSAQVLAVRRSVQKSVFDELCKLVDPKPTVSSKKTKSTKSNSSAIGGWKPSKSKCNVVMFVGLQGSGKTTSLTKFANYYARKGLRVGLIGCDTYRAGAFDQLKQNAQKAKVAFYGSYSESDPTVIAKDGLKKFKSSSAGPRFDLVIVDTSGRHKQADDLFDEMKDVYAVVKPDLTVLVVDGTIGQAAETQANAFNQAVDVGGLVITKLDGHAKGGGAVSAVAATGSPILFIGTGEHIQDLEPFVASRFVGKMLGMGDITGLMEKISDIQRPEQQKELLKRLNQGQFTIRDFQSQFQSLMQLGPVSKVLGMLPGGLGDMISGGALQGGNSQNVDEKSEIMMKRMMGMLDSMTAAELDSDGKVFITQPKRIIRLARGSGTSPMEVEHLLKSYRGMADMVKKVGGKGGLLSGGRGAGGPGGLSQMTKLAQQMGRMNPQMAQMMNNLGGAGGMGQQMQQMMQQLQGGGGMPDLSSLMGAFGGGGGGGPSGGSRRRR